MAEDTAAELRAQIASLESEIARREISDDRYFTGRRGGDLTRLRDLQKRLRDIEND